MSNALLIVEPEFLTRHIGVRRVTLHYWRKLEANGLQVTLAAPINGRLRVGRGMDLKSVTRWLQQQGSDTPAWTSDRTSKFSLRSKTLRSPRNLIWSREEVSLADFDLSLATNPWICAEGLPPGRLSIGIMHDMVPNLLACGAIDLGSPMDIYAFANDHDRGYRLWLERADMIVGGSESAISDFGRFYRRSGKNTPKLRQYIPFDVEEDERLTGLPEIFPRRPKLILVNALDPRKNFTTIRSVVSNAQSIESFDIDVIGIERMPTNVVTSFLKDLSKHGSKVRWYRNATDETLSRLYLKSDALLFPSLYEGLGLPILESQFYGVPAITSNTSSCAEVNINKSLSAEPDNIPDLTSRLISVLRKDKSIISGRPLRDQLKTFIEGKANQPWMG